MAIIKPGIKPTDHRIISSPSDIGSDTEEIPFIPATDLAPSKEISDDDIAAIAMTLRIALPDENSPLSLWGRIARLGSVSSRG